VSRSAPVLLTWLVVAVTPLSAQTEEQLIREARARSNAAIATHDLDGLARVWMENVHVVTSTGAQEAGRELNRARFAAQFLDRPDVVYVRMPDTVEVFPAWEVASERGHWTGEWTQADGQTLIGGTYLAQWRKVKGEWLIQAELFVPTHCSGSSYCKKHP
jgi:ketosteroid isomerase-like protein